LFYFEGLSNQREDGKPQKHITLQGGTKMANADRFAGVVAEISDLNKTDTSGKPVINLWIERTEEIIEGIKEEIRARIVLFGSLAQKAAEEIEEGKVVMFTNCRRNPRAYVTDRGTEVETVDLVAQGYTVLTKTQYERAKDQIAARSISIDQLYFTDEDREKILSKMVEPEGSAA
jgi:hypothetical protein